MELIFFFRGKERRIGIAKMTKAVIITLNDSELFFLRERKSSGKIKTELLQFGADRRLSIFVAPLSAGGGRGVRAPASSDVEVPPTPGLRRPA